MSDRAELAIVMLVFAAVALVVAAPLAGRSGAPGLADLAMASGAACGTAAFAVAGVSTWRAARTRSKAGPQARAQGDDA